MTFRASESDPNGFEVSRPCEQHPAPTLSALAQHAIVQKVYTSVAHISNMHRKHICILELWNEAAYTLGS